MSSFNFLEEFLSYDQKDKVCINLKHDIKVFFKLDDSIMVKDYSNDNCISVNGQVHFDDESRMFSLYRDGFKVHHNSTGCLDIEIINGDTSEFYNTFNARMQCNYPTITTWSNSDHRMFNYHIKSCDDFFNQKSTGNSQQMNERASMLIDTCLFEKKDNGDINFNFFNGLDILQSQSGQTIVTFIKYQTEIKMIPTGTAIIKFDSYSIVSSNSHFYAKKGLTEGNNLTKIDGIILTY